MTGWGSDTVNSRPYHPQTCGKVERLHRSLKRFLTKQDPVSTIGELQDQLDQFRTYYNEVRPHRAIGRRNQPRRSAHVPKRHPGRPP